MTVTVGGRGFAGGGAPRPVMLPGISHDCCSMRSSVMRLATPGRSPVAEWHDAHASLKYASPALALPTTIVGGFWRDTS